MKKYLLIITLIALFCGCSSQSDKNGTNEIEQNLLSELYEDGYSTKELSLRLQCPEEQIVACIQDGAKPSLQYEDLEKLYNLNKDEDIIPTKKIKDKLSNCLWEIYTQSQNLPIMAQYTKIDVDKVANALIKRKPLKTEDSIKALIAFVNLKYKIDTIPKEINVTPYFRITPELQKITLPRDCNQYSQVSLTEEQNAKISYYLWQAEEFEKRANANLVASINKKVNNRIDDATNDFIKKDVGSYFNDIKCLFKKNKDIDKFYKEKLSGRVDINGLQKNLRQEILSYCISINCSRILLVNEMLNYDENVDNLSIAQKMKLRSINVEMNKINELVTARRINDATEAATLIATSFLGGPATTTGAKVGTQSLSVITKNPAIVSALNDLFIYTGLEKTMQDCFGNTPLSIDDKTKNLKNTIHSILKKKIYEQLSSLKNASYRQTLNDNTTTFYSKIRTDLNIK